MKRFLLVFVMLTLLLTACQHLHSEVVSEVEDTYSAQEFELEQESQPTHELDPEPAIAEEPTPVNISAPEPNSSGLPGSFNEAIAQFSEDEIVREYWNRSENIAFLDEWVENYRQGIPGSVVILIDEVGIYRLFLLQSDGSAAYTIHEYISSVFNVELADSPPRVLQSSLVVKRYHDYVFGADFGILDEARQFEGSDAIVINDFHSIAVNRRHDRFDTERLEWNPQTDASLVGITPRQAEQRAYEASERLNRYLSATQGGMSFSFPSGVYLRQNVLDAASAHEVQIRFSVATYLRTVGAMRMGDNVYFIVYGHYELDALNQGLHNGHVYVVSLDGRVVFSQSMLSGGFFLIDDAKQEIIVP